MGLDDVLENVEGLSISSAVKQSEVVALGRVLTLNPGGAEYDPDVHTPGWGALSSVHSSMLRTQ